MKQMIYVIVLAFSQSIFGQNNLQQGKIEYDMYLNLSTIKNYNSVLYFKKNESFFYWKNIKKNNSIPNLEGDEYGNANVSLEVMDSIGTVNYINWEKDSLFTRTLWLRGVKYIIKEKRPKIKWVLLEDTKKIGSFLCKKAIGDFRGRKYTAWYSQDLPIPYGPWKLQGLPGVIVRVYDEKKEVQFLLKSVKIPAMYNTSLHVFKDGEEITIEQFALKQNALLDEIVEAFISKLPRGVTANLETSSQNFLEKFESNKGNKKE